MPLTQLKQESKQSELKEALDEAYEKGVFIADQPASEEPSRVGSGWIVEDIDWKEALYDALFYKLLPPSSQAALQRFIELALTTQKEEIEKAIIMAELNPAQTVIIRRALKQ